MIRTQVQLTEEQIEWLRQKANERKISISQIIREGVEFLKEREMKVNKDKRKKALELIGRFSSGLSDVSVRHDRYLGEAFKG